MLFPLKLGIRVYVGFTAMIPLRCSICFFLQDHHAIMYKHLYGFNNTPPHLRHYIVVLFPRKLALSTRTPALCYYKKGPSLEFVFSVIISSFSDLQRNRMTPERDLFCTIEWLTADYEGCLKKYPNEQFEGETHNCIVTNRNRFISEHSYFLCPIFFSS